jgi:hypothetical protein
MKPCDNKAVSDTQTSHMKVMTFTWTRSEGDVEEEGRGSGKETKGKPHLLKRATPRFTGSVR